MENLTILDDILVAFDRAINAALPGIQLSVGVLAESFLVIMIVFAGATYAFGNTSAGAEGVLKRIILTSVTLFFLTNERWLTLATIVVNSFGKLGLRAGGFSTVQLTLADLFAPSRVAALGVNLADQIIEKANDIGGILSGEFGSALTLWLAALIMGLAFLVIAIQVFMLLIEFKIVTLGGLILLPFALFDRTASLAQGVLSYVIAAGLKLFVIGIVVSFAFAIIPPLSLQENFTISEAFGIMATAFVFLALAIRAPGLAASMVSGGPQLGIGAAAQSVGTVAGAAGAAVFAGVGAYKFGSAAKQKIGDLVGGRSPGGGGGSGNTGAGPSAGQKATAGVRSLGRAGAATVGVAASAGRDGGGGGSPPVNIGSKS